MHLSLLVVSLLDGSQQSLGILQLLSADYELLGRCDTSKEVGEGSQRKIELICEGSVSYLLQYLACLQRQVITSPSFLDH